MRLTAKLICGISCAALLMGCASSAAASSNGSSVSSSASSADSTKEEENTGIAVPYELDDGNLTLESLFQYDGMNPDCGYAECTEAASIQLTNSSSQYLKHASVSVTTEDGNVYTFEVYDIPAGSMVYAFDTQNQSVVSEPVIQEAAAATEYSEDSSLLNQTVTAETSEMAITLQNIGSDYYEDLIVTYHCSIDGILFGGISYTTEAGALDSGESTTVDASEAWLGEATVVAVGE